jgi:hypothetical protein
MVGPWVADVPVGPTDGSAILGMVGGSINSSLKFKLSPQKVDEALGRSALLEVNGVDGADMMIAGLTPKK